MSEELKPRRVVTGRVIPPGEPEPEDDEWRSMTPEERIEMVWTLTLAAMGWNRESAEELRLDRSAVRIVRP